MAGLLIRKTLKSTTNLNVNKSEMLNWLLGLLKSDWKKWVLRHLQKGFRVCDRQVGKEFWIVGTWYVERKQDWQEEHEIW